MTTPNDRLGRDHLGRDRRVVDSVEVGNPSSEASHGYDASDAVSREVHGKPIRQTRGWMHFALTTFDDTPVTVSCSFFNPVGAGDVVSRRFDLVVEDSVVATRALAFTSYAQATSAIVVDVVVPFALTKGKTRIAVFVRARDGLTPGLHALRTIQDHAEIDPTTNSSGIPR